MYTISLLIKKYKLKLILFSKNKIGNYVPSATQAMASPFANTKHNTVRAYLEASLE